MAQPQAQVSPNAPPASILSASRQNSLNATAAAAAVAASQDQELKLPYLIFDGENVVLVYQCNSEPMAVAFKSTGQDISARNLPTPFNENKKVLEEFDAALQKKQKPNIQFIVENPAAAAQGASGGKPRKTRKASKKPSSSSKPQKTKSASKRLVLKSKPKEGDTIKLPNNETRVVRNVQGIMCVRIQKNNVPISSFCVVKRS